MSLSYFLLSYSEDAFEWEKPTYDPHSWFLWNSSISMPSRNVWKPSAERDGAFSDGQSSPGSESLSDMSVSISGIASGHYSSIPPRMKRSRNVSVSAARPIAPRSDDSRSLSDMSISSDGKSSLDASAIFEGFSLGATSCDLSGNVILPEALTRSRGRRFKNDGWDDSSGLEAVSRILEWITSLFTTVASSAVEHTGQPGDDVLSTDCFSGPQTSWSGPANEGNCLVPCTKDAILDTWPNSFDIIVRLNPVHCDWIGPPKPIKANPQSVMMPGAVDYEPINPEQPTTAKSVCMWGRRLERIPKVKVSGQKEAVYCFDSRKQRQKQKGRHTASQTDAPDNVHEGQQPTRIFYRARPLYSAFTRQDLSATPVDAVKIAQGQVLLQNISPVRFDAAHPHCRGDVQRTFLRYPLTVRTNDLKEARETGYATNLRRVRKMPIPGFL